MEGETNTEMRQKKAQRKEGRKRKAQSKEKTCPVKQHAGPRFPRIDSAILFVSLPPLVRGVGWHDRVGQKSRAFVSGCPISICIPGDRDEVLHRSSSKKDGTLCPVSYSSALDHLRWSMDGMVDHEVDPLDLAEGFDAVEMLVPWDWEST